MAANRYKAGPWPVLDAAPGEEFEAEFTAEMEAELVAAGRIELLPREYRVLGGSEVFETKTGDTFTAAMPQHQESALVAGGHIERIAAAPKKKGK